MNDEDILDTSPMGIEKQLTRIADALEKLTGPKCRCTQLNEEIERATEYYQKGINKAFHPEGYTDEGSNPSPPTCPACENKMSWIEGFEDHICKECTIKLGEIWDQSIGITNAEFIGKLAEAGEKFPVCTAKDAVQAFENLGKMLKVEDDLLKTGIYTQKQIDDIKEWTRITMENYNAKEQLLRDAKEIIEAIHFGHTLHGNEEEIRETWLKRYEEMME